MVTAVATDSREPTTDEIAAAIWSALGEVVDPEIPVVSIVELGIVRGVTCVGGECVVTLTPTYSGCPAMRVIESDVRAAVARVSHLPLRIETALAPAWSTDGIAPEARRKLATAGIAPPGPARRADTPSVMREAVVCPQCGSTGTEEVARFGSTPCKAQYRCRDCREPFDHFKAH